MCSWWWAEEPPETCRASVRINKFKKRCIFLVVICNYITMHEHMNIKFKAGFVISNTTRIGNWPNSCSDPKFCVCIYIYICFNHVFSVSHNVGVFPIWSLSESFSSLSNHNRKVPNPLGNVIFHKRIHKSQPLLPNPDLQYSSSNSTYFFSNFLILLYFLTLLEYWEK